jgi:DNA polymerase III gamma/tau subunit
MTSPRISAFQIHEWIHETLRLEEKDIRMVQIDGLKRQVYIKFTDNTKMQSIYTNITGKTEYRHETREISNVKIEIAGMGRKKIRIANLPPETPDLKIRQTMAQYGEITEIIEEQWSKAYRYTVSNGIRIATITLTKHIPSVITTDGVRVLISYEGQPLTCFGCGETGHQYQNCSHKRQPRQQQKYTHNKTWADIIQGRTETNPQTVDEGETQTPIAMEQDKDPDLEDTAQEQTRTMQWPTTEYNIQSIQEKTATRGGKRSTSQDSTNNVDKKQDPDTQSVTENIMDETDTNNETATGITTQNIDGTEYGRQKEKKNDTPMERKQDNPEVDSIPEQEREEEREKTHSEKKTQIENCEGTPKPPKKIRINKDRKSPRERTRSKTRQGLTPYM